MTERRGKTESVALASEPQQEACAAVRSVQWGLDTLNVHILKILEDVLRMRTATRRPCPVQSHCAPRLASWMNLAEIEIGVLTRQCVDRRLPSREVLGRDVAALQRCGNDQQRSIEWNVTRQDADRERARDCVPLLAWRPGGRRPSHTAYSMREVPA